MTEIIKNSQEKTILSLWRAGHSQKEISVQLKITPLTIRKILQEHGFETHNFRALNETVTNVILLLVRNGVLFSEIENICNISFHAIRDVVARHNLQYESKRVRNTMPPVTVAPGFVQNADFLERYLSGESFCRLCEVFNFPDEEILNEFLSMNETQIDMHKAALWEKIREDAKCNLSTTSIARKHCISMAIVRDILREKTAEEAAESVEIGESTVSDETEAATESFTPEVTESEDVVPSEPETIDFLPTEAENAI